MTSGGKPRAADILKTDAPEKYREWRLLGLTIAYSEEAGVTFARAWQGMSIALGFHTDSLPAVLAVLSEIQGLHSAALNVAAESESVDG
ncbi:MAG: hypothetical protein GWN29_04985 [Gammaproteobacteria bacterium]|nr:hypothetical protein [Gammaproteobacteria bacterium]NIV51108.1 hypothetical protein [Gammaproteobacteria bacterium]NIW23961.1 hypothetical protein [Gammaproteobacteria bacterium]NIX85050.1 hypothetical protein [Gammaproteobacteria bacterium]